MICDLLDDTNENEWTVRECHLRHRDNSKVAMESSGWSGRAFGGSLGRGCWVAWRRFQLRLCARPESWHNCRHAYNYIASLLAWSVAIIYKFTSIQMSEHCVQIGGQPFLPSGSEITSDCLNCAWSPIKKSNCPAASLKIQFPKTSGSIVMCGFTSHFHTNSLYMSTRKKCMFGTICEISEYAAVGFGFWPGYVGTVWWWWGYKRSLRSTSTWPNPWTQQCHRTNQTFWKLRGKINRVLPSSTNFQQTRILAWLRTKIDIFLCLADL